MLEICSLVKRFAGIHVLRDLSFSVSRGEILGCLGPNGSGKSTTFKIIVGLLDPTSGHVQLDGRRIDADPTAFRRRLGYVPEEPHLYTHLTAPEYLRLVGRLRGFPLGPLETRVDAMLDLLDLTASSGCGLPDAPCAPADLGSAGAGLRRLRPDGHPHARPATGRALTERARLGDY